MPRIRSRGRKPPRARARCDTVCGSNVVFCANTTAVVPCAVGQEWRSPRELGCPYGAIHNLCVWTQSLICVTNACSAVHVRRSQLCCMIWTELSVGYITDRHRHHQADIDMDSFLHNGAIDNACLTESDRRQADCWFAVSLDILSGLCESRQVYEGSSLNDETGNRNPCDRESFSGNELLQHAGGQ